MTKTRFLTSIGAMALLLSLPIASSGQTGMVAIAGDPVATTSGKLAGTTLASGVRAYLGVPFAKPPTGALRWAAPQQVQWDGVYNADRLPAECVQILRPHNVNHYFGEEKVSEDCLYLNIWAPPSASAKAKLPVVVFLYGGGFTIGSSAIASYGGEEVAKNGAVFVNLNYRVGFFGFFSHPELSKEQGGHSGNYGIMDQQAALRWIKANIAQFGGDPDQILLVGQSAGAASVQTNLFSPLANGLFRAAATLSACNMTVRNTPLADAEATGLQLQKRLGVSNLAELRDIPADRILAATADGHAYGDADGIPMAGLTVDGYVLPAPLLDLAEANRFAHVPLLATYTNDDTDVGRNPIGAATTPAEYRAAVDTVYGAKAKDFLARFPVPSEGAVRQSARRAVNMSGHELGARRCAAYVTKGGSQAWIAELARKHPFTPGIKFGDLQPDKVEAYHTSDIPYWFGTFDAYNRFRKTRDWQPGDRALSKTMMGTLISMARTGRPTLDGKPWPAWSPTSETKALFGQGTSIEKLDTARLDWLAANPGTLPAPKSRKPRD